VTSELKHRADGQAEIIVAGQSFPITGEPPQAVIPNQLLKNVHLSEFHDQIAVKPSGVLM
jgi:hypothetical protein